MTAQSGERILYKGEQHRMASEPLNQYLISRKDICFQSHRTDCWRGYFGSWKIENNKLYLIGLKGTTKDGEIGVKELFNGKTEVFSNWYTGEIRIPMGELLEYVHMGYASEYEFDAMLTFEKGVLIKEELIDNRYKE